MAFETLSMDTDMGLLIVDPTTLPSGQQMQLPPQNPPRPNQPVPQPQPIPQGPPPAPGSQPNPNPQPAPPSPPPFAGMPLTASNILAAMSDACRGSTKALPVYCVQFDPRSGSPVLVGTAPALFNFVPTKFVIGEQGVSWVTGIVAETFGDWPSMTVTPGDSSTVPVLRSLRTEPFRGAKIQIALDSAPNALMQYRYGGGCRFLGEVTAFELRLDIWGQGTTNVLVNLASMCSAGFAELAEPELMWTPPNYPY